jgi:hypothetical protein
MYKVITIKVSNFSMRSNFVQQVTKNDSKKAKKDTSDMMYDKEGYYENMSESLSNVYVKRYFDCQRKDVI